ncbi:MULTISPECIES: NADPH-dependent FMN reductase [Roseobacteraceae]|uniref:NADPH-dependent FMN reductase n=1 Tax=Roseobacteraceae TaxID=2854170 RepID=UPI00125F24A4|nr:MULTISPECIES: NADPH-dependent FMN reductase [Roseobacteraceae]KAB6717242.1 NADPH-dependent FMN reductase [Roseobacter sp. TSBP12]|tara:strand:- start:5620 stop:6159 length:540 start_codon:yes stop_codon:yes gene_type:complete
MSTILGISGSLRKASFNTGLLRAAVEVTSDDVQIDIGSIADVPLYNADAEAAEGLPPAVQVLQAQLASADGVLLVTPEYNNGIPGVFKNAIDWMSRGEGLKLFVGKPIAVIGASPGGFGTIMAQNHWLPVLRTLKCDLWTEGRLMVSRAGSLYDEAGNLTDDKTRAMLGDYIKSFAASL